MWMKHIIFYKPILLVTFLSLVTAVCVSLSDHIHFMNAWMGFFLLLLSFLKFLNISGFSKSFAKYDVIAAQSPTYAKAYPFIELGLSILYLTAAFPLFTNIAMMLVMLIGSIGIWQAVQSKSCLKCACVGSGFDIPVGRVTLFENFVMFTMAAVNMLEYFLLI